MKDIVRKIALVSASALVSYFIISKFKQSPGSIVYPEGLTETEKNQIKQFYDVMGDSTNKSHIEICGKILNGNYTIYKNEQGKFIHIELVNRFDSNSFINIKIGNI